MSRKVAKAFSDSFGTPGTMLGLLYLFSSGFGTLSTLSSPLKSTVKVGLLNEFVPIELVSLLRTKFYQV